MNIEGGTPDEDQSYDGKMLSEATQNPGISGRNGPLTGRDGKVSARHATLHRETVAKGEKNLSQIYTEMLTSPGPIMGPIDDSSQTTTCRSDIQLETHILIQSS